jgi:hypothetical protein
MKTKQIKKAAGLFLAVLILLGFTGKNTFSQQGQGQSQGKQGPPSAEERLKQVDEKVIKPLNLTKAKHDAVYKAYKDFFAEAEKLKKEAQAQQTPPDRTKMDTFRNQRDEKIKKVLTDAEYKKWQELEEAYRPKRGGGQQGQGQPTKQN